MSATRQKKRRGVATVVGLGFLDTTLYIIHYFSVCVRICTAVSPNLSANPSRANPSELLPPDLDFATESAVCQIGSGARKINQK